MLLQRHPNNPILKPDPNHDWENFAVFNGTVIKKDNRYFLFYRAIGEETEHYGKKVRLSTIGKAVSNDGVDFSDRQLFIKPEYEWEKYGCEDPRVVKVENKYLIFYTALANYPPNHLGIKVGVAISDDLKTIREKHLVTPFNAKAMAMFPEKINNLHTVVLTVNTDKPPSHVAVAQFKDLSTLWDMRFWLDWYSELDNHLINLRRVNSDQVEIGAPPVKTDYGWLLIHSYIKHYLSDNVKKIFRIEAALLDRDNPQKIVGRVEKPLLIPEASYELEGQIKDVVFPEGALIENNELKVYYGGADNVCALASIDWRILATNFEINAPATLKCSKFVNNPLLEAVDHHSWEAKAVFNPTAVELNGKTYIIYRTTAADNLSHLGLAVSYDGMYIDERLNEPIYPLRSRYEKPKKPGMAAGCEDPRATLIGNTIYLCYTAFDGALPRLALTSISVENFLKRNWSAWSEPKIISPPRIADKDGVLFPEKINGQYAFFHRIEPNIIYDTVDNLEFSGRSFLSSKGLITPLTGTWDAVKIGVNNPPIKTEAGWLVFYHGISAIDRHYRLGALLLDFNDPTRVINRTPYPILEPETVFETKGVVDNVVFPCGHIFKNGEVFLYYGGADKVVCGAKIRLDSLLDYLKKSKNQRYLTF
jgi:predicted GH43/DUF377 family glycosyl hydrolase